ncbi:MAG: hypothetical protein K2N73_15125 [Lachnospiraceae bacterium]|nr:hypothetical protein [Lachnospiraceae bacterium]
MDKVIIYGIGNDGKCILEIVHDIQGNRDKMVLEHFQTRFSIPSDKI